MYHYFSYTQVGVVQIYLSNEKEKFHMSVISHYRWRLSIGTVLTLLALVLALVFALSSRAFTFANVTLTRLSIDPYTNTTSYHATEVEPDTFSFGSTIVSNFQAGRCQDGGASNVGWDTSSDGGTTWTNGFLPGTTVYATPAGPYARVTDPSVAFDAKHGVWMASTLALNTSLVGVAVVVNRSTNGATIWSNPVTVAAATGTQNFDKDWIVC